MPGGCALRSTECSPGTVAGSERAGVVAADDGQQDPGDGSWARGAGSGGAACPGHRSAHGQRSGPDPADGGAGSGDRDRDEHASGASGGPGDTGGPRPDGGAGAGSEDDLDGFEPTLSRIFGRMRFGLGLVIALAMLIPAGGWALDRLAFSSAGDAVEEALGDEAAIADSLLLVRSVDCLGRSRTGSAFSLDLDGRPTVVTNRHVVEGARSTIVQPLDAGTGVQVQTVLLAATADVAVLVVDDEEVPPALPGGPAASLGQPIVTVGFPGARPAFREGRVDRVEAGRLLLALEVGAGASGSPVLDAEGRVVGQVFARTAEGRGVATPLQEVVAAARDGAPAPACP